MPLELTDPRLVLEIWLMMSCVSGMQPRHQAPPKRPQLHRLLPRNQPRQLLTVLLHSLNLSFGLEDLSLISRVHYAAFKADPTDIFHAFSSAATPAGGSKVSQRCVTDVKKVQRSVLN